MASAAPANLTALRHGVEALPDFPSATFAGIVPDAAHLNRGGYHVSIEDLARFGNSGDYSNTRPLDKAPPVTRPNGVRLSAALDMGLSKADMVKLFGRVKRVYDDRGDPRRRFVAYWNVWNGTSLHPTRFDFQGNRVLSTDDSHKWHSHEDIPRLYVDAAASAANASTAWQAHLSIWKGETKAQWIAAHAGGDMPLDAADLAAIKKTVLEAIDTDVLVGSAGFRTWLSAHGWQTSISLRDMVEYDLHRTLIPNNAAADPPPPIPAVVVNIDALATAIAAKVVADVDCGEAASMEQITAAVRAVLNSTELRVRTL